jgi:hypothetical protein
MILTPEELRSLVELKHSLLGHALLRDTPKYS